MKESGKSLDLLFKLYVDLMSINLPWNSKNKPRGLYFSKAFLRGLSMKGNLGFKIEWAILIVRMEFTVFALFYFVFVGNFQVQAPGELIFGGAI